MPEPHPPRRLLLAIACAVGAAGCGCGKDTSGDLPKIGRASLIACGEKTLLIPPPPNMIRSDSIFPVWDQEMAACLPPGRQLLAYYSTHEDRVRIERQAAPVSDRYCLLHVLQEDTGRDVKLSHLDDQREEIEDNQQAVANAIGSQLNKVLAFALDTANQESVSTNTDNLEVSMPKVTGANAVLQGWFGETGQTFGYTVRADLPRGEDDQTEATSMVTSTVVTAINGRLLSFQTCASQEDGTGQQWTEETALLWARTAFSANPEYRGGSPLWQAAKLLTAIALITGIYRVSRWLKQILDDNAEMLHRDTRGSGKSKDAGGKDGGDSSASNPRNA